MGRRGPLTHAVRVEEDAEAFRVLFAKLEAAGERAGWLAIEAPALDSMTAGGERVAATPSAAMPLPGEAPAPVIESLPWKTVEVGVRRSVAVKTRRGPPVLRDLLREHFRGCRVVLVRGAVSLPLLRRRDDDWELAGLDGAARRLSTDQLLAALRAPHLPV